MLARLMETPQSPKYHPEGSVWNHTLLVLDEAAKVKSKSSRPQWFMWAALLHDIGKPDTTRTRKGKITSYGHELRGAVLARQFFSACGQGGGSAEYVASLVKWHMETLFFAKSLPFSNLESMKREADPREVALLGFCDRMGRLGAKKEEELRNYRAFLTAAAETAARS